MSSSSSLFRALGAVTNELESLTNPPSPLGLRKASYDTFARTVLESHLVHDTHHTIDRSGPVQHQPSPFPRQKNVKPFSCIHLLFDLSRPLGGI